MHPLPTLERSQLKAIRILEHKKEDQDERTSINQQVSSEPNAKREFQRKTALELIKERQSKGVFAERPVSSEPNAKKEFQRKTALQVINDMVNARLKQEEVDILDDYGIRREGTFLSLEYELLQERGLKVLGVSIGNLRLNPKIEKTIIRQWSSSWLVNAKAESEQVERKRNLVEMAGQEIALRQYANFLSKDLIQKRPIGVKETVKALLLRTQDLIRKNQQLHSRMEKEQQQIKEIITQIESDVS